MNTTYRAIASTLAASTCWLTGCAGVLVAAAVGAAGGATYIVYREGKLEATQPASMDTAWAAAQKTVKELELKPQESVKDALTAKLEAEQSDGTNVWIWLDRAGDDLTKVTIRVGVLGDEATSRLILTKMQQNMNLPGKQAMRVQDTGATPEALPTGERHADAAPTR